VRFILYLSGLIWLFLGVSIGSDKFMGAIERITSKKVRVFNPDSGRHATMKVWNETVANLTLMALGSSAPEILLSIIELLFKEFYSGDLGPSTIVGSAAFNLFCIIAVCVVAIPDGQVRLVKERGVFFVTAAFSVFAYLWLFFIVAVSSKDIVEWWEGLLTLLFFPLLIGIAFGADKGFFAIASSAKQSRMPVCKHGHKMKFYGTSQDDDGWACDARLEVTGCRSGMTNFHQGKGTERYRCETCDFDLCAKCAQAQLDQVRHITVSDISKDDLAFLEKKLSKEHGKALTDEQVVRLIQREHSEPMSRAAYRVHATRQMMGHKGILPALQEDMMWKMTAIVPVETTNDGMEDVQCPAGHYLQKFPTAKDDYQCDVCFGKLPKGSWLWGCRKCNFDTCTDCRSKSITEPPEAIIQFMTDSYAVLESVGTLNILVQRTGTLSQGAVVDFRTRDGTAKAWDDYEPVKGKLEFAPGEDQKEIIVRIIDDMSYEDDEDFFVDLSNPRSLNSEGITILGERRTTKIAIIDDDEPGILLFSEETMNMAEGEESKVIEATVIRKAGSSGVVTCQYATEDAKATAGVDYLAASGTLEFANGQLSAVIKITILPRGRYDNSEDFRVILTEPTGGAKFDENTDGGEESCILTIFIESDAEAKGRVDRVMNMLMLDWDKAQIGHANWRDQFASALSVTEEETEGGPTIFDWVMHILTVFWKLLFALVPPADFCGGWACFVGALSMIGLVTAFINELASLLGCVIDVPDMITAMTMVALGTSLPDTFASKTAALCDPFADASVGNVTGSNSVNVFLGLGLPWLIGAIYWETKDDLTEWKSRFQHHSHITAYGSGKLVVQSKGLAVSVILFTCLALISLALLNVKRRFFGGELGGPKVVKWATCFILVSLWVIHVTTIGIITVLDREPC